MVTFRAGIALLVLAAYCSNASAANIAAQPAAKDGAMEVPLQTAALQRMHPSGPTMDGDGSRQPKVNQHMGRLLLATSDSGTESGSTAVPAQNDTDSTMQIGNVTIMTTASNTGYSNNTVNSSIVHAQPVVAANLTAAMQRYVRLRASRIMHLLADVAWLVYTIGNFAQRIFALMVPLVKIGQTGQLTVNAASALTLAQLVADVICRWGDMMAKIFLVWYRAIVLAATLPPAA